MTSPAGGLPAPYRLAQLDEIDSTNAEAMRRALAGDSGPLWILAERQTGGKGRSGRVWETAPGNLFASLLIPATGPVAKAGQLSLVAGVAVIDALRKAGLDSGELRLKWPNDILIGTAKLGGVLVESSAPATADGRIAVIGVGLNLESTPEGLQGSATNLAAHGLTLSPGDALCFLAGAMDTWLKTWNDGGGFDAVRNAWLERAGAPGEALTVHTLEGDVAGSFVGLDADGALLIASADGRERAFTYGDVTLSGNEDNDKT
jgi:BirA family transcriptional regulator, biotin operon repressor / biotin---[acetyl-CoA-carboxylase] ligase